jgi:predicted AAA+ superfamily ATPase
MYKYRFLQAYLTEKNATMGSVLLAGPRRAGKSTLAKKLLELWGYTDIERRYISFDTPDTLARFQNDPVLFMQNLEVPCVLDEVQNIPEIFKYIKADLDKNFQKKIRYILTGSQQFGMMKGVSESLAGRILIKELPPFTQSEIEEIPVEEMQSRIQLLLSNPAKIRHPDITNKNQILKSTNLFERILQGGFPPMAQIEAEHERRDWMRSYIQTYIQRDIRQISLIHDLALFNRFVSLVASRSSKIINYSAIGKDLGINFKTAQHYISLLEAGFLWQSLQPFYKNSEKRLTKSAKGIFRDSALHCNLMGIFSAESLALSPLQGGIVESFAINEWLRLNESLNLDGRFYFFDQASHHEVDLILELNSKIYLFEFKSAATFQPQFVEGFKKFKQAFPKEKVTASYLISQKPDINLVGENTWTIPYSYFW